MEGVDHLLYDRSVGMISVRHHDLGEHGTPSGRACRYTECIYRETSNLLLKAGSLAGSNIIQVQISPIGLSVLVACKNT